jgi:tetratricopeptide (TPR) repeat protein
MKTPIQHLALSELYAAHQYFERLHHALHEVSTITPCQDIKKRYKSFCGRLYQFAQQYLFRCSEVRAVPFGEMSFTEMHQVNAQQFNALESLVGLNFLAAEELSPITCHYINLNYEFCHYLHNQLKEKSDIDIQTPRAVLVEVLKDKSCDKKESIPRYFLNFQKLIERAHSDQGIFHSLEYQREVKYRELIQKGQNALIGEEHEEAKAHFQRARNYQETAEVLTLIGWCEQLLGQLENAKTFCLRAIQKDPQYGPPYNDFGSYLLAEGKAEESLRWFELAKQALYFQNREYPYINAGRAYMAKKEYRRALDEFAKALTLAPHHEELHQTIERLNKMLENSKWNFTEGEVAPPSPFFRGRIWPFRARSWLSFSINNSIFMIIKTMAPMACKLKVAKKFKKLLSPSPPPPLLSLRPFPKRPIPLSFITVSFGNSTVTEQ